MVAVRISPDLRFAVVAAPSYFAAHEPPKKPQDLARHRCINYRFATGGGLYVWEFKAQGRPLQVRVDGPLILNDSDMVLNAALAGLGIAMAYEDTVAEHIAQGRLVRVLHTYCPSFPGCYLYYTSRRQTPPALKALIDALRFTLGKQAVSR